MSVHDFEFYQQTRFFVAVYCFQTAIDKLGFVQRFIENVTQVFQGRTTDKIE